MSKNTHKKTETAATAVVLKEFDTTGGIAFHYGFSPIVAPKITEDDKVKAKGWKMDETYQGETEERLAVTRLFHNLAFSSIAQPPMLYVKKPFAKSEFKKKSNYDTCGLEILNVEKASAEAIIIKTAWAMLEEYGCKDMRIEINSIGDKDSFAKFERELHIYFRKNIHLLSGEWRTKFKENNLNILSLIKETREKPDQKLEKSAEKNADTHGSEEFLIDTPKSISFLSESSRDHFKEVLEFLECLGLPYEINNGLIPNKNYASHTVFEIRGRNQKSDHEILLASGGRYDYTGRRAGYKKDVPSVGATVWYPKHQVSLSGTRKKDKRVVLAKIRPARFYLVQLGSLAKFQTLGIVEKLRQENIPVYHSLTKENIGGQMASAEYLKVSHLLILGQKEAIEHSIVVRSVDVRDQETIKVTELAKYLRRLK